MTVIPSVDYGLTLWEPVVVDPARTALLIVDMQYYNAARDQGFSKMLERIEPGSAAYFDERVEKQVVPAISSLIDRLRPHGVRIVHLCMGSHDRELGDMTPRLRATVRRFEKAGGVEDLFWAESPLFEILEQLRPEPEDLVVEKTSFGAFNGSQLERVLREQGIEAIFVAGVSTNSCVETTARDAADRGFATVLVDECLADYDQAWHDATLQAFHFNFGPVLRSADEVVEAVEKRGTISAPSDL
jgi:nicotinamidase-related amidase